MNEPRPETPFPDRLEQVSGGPRARETFGWLPSLVAVALAAYGANLVADARRTRFGPGECVVLAVLFGGAVGLGWLEVRRRTRRAVLVAQGSDVGVYRAGRLCETTTREDVLRAEVSVFRSLKGLLAIACLGVAFLGYGLADDFQDLASRAGPLIAGALLLLAAVSLARTGWFCATLRLPGDGGRTGLIPRSDFRRISSL